VSDHLKPKDCPTCGTPDALYSKEPGAWPAFYESAESSDHILWVDAGGRVINGGGLPTYSADRLTGWFSPGSIFRWVAPAPVPRRHGLNYPDFQSVISSFRRERARSSTDVAP
jgi:hypothetical protein